MANTKNPKKLMSVTLAVIIIVAISVLLYVNLPQDTTPQNGESPPDGNQTETPIFTVTYNTQQHNYTLEDIEDLPTYTGQGGYRTSFPQIRGTGNYTGVNITTFVDAFDETLQNYSIHIVSSDQNKTYNYSTIMGNVDIYDPVNVSNETPIGNQGLTMILCYKYEGEYLDQDRDGILRIAFVDEQGSITSSGLWWKFVISMEIIPE